MVEIVRNKAVNYALTGQRGSARTYQQRMLALFGASTIIGLWTQGEASGTTCVDSSGNGRNGTYTGVQLAQPGVDRFTCAKYDGLTSYANIYSVSLASAFNGNEGTLAVMLRIAGSVWLDGAARRVINVSTGANSIYIRRTTVNGQIGFSRMTSTVLVDGLSSISWVHVALSWSLTTNQVIAYIDGSSVGTPGVCPAWSGTLNATQCAVGAANTTPTQAWSGWLQYAMLLNRAATPAEIAQMARAVVV